MEQALLVWMQDILNIFDIPNQPELHHFVKVFYTQSCSDIYITKSLKFLYIGDFLDINAFLVPKIKRVE